MKKICFALTAALAACTLDGSILTSDAQETRKVSVQIDRESDTGKTVSDRLFGFNIVYAKNPDSLWTSGVLADAIKAVNPGFLRYPGGTVNTYFHWEHPTGNGWEDMWDPEYDPSTDRPASEYMDIDEYIALVKKTGAEPLVGINIDSGFRWNRVEEGIQEALRLMKYCKEKGLDVKYWYLGNEPYMHNCNGGPYKPAEYGRMVNVFVPRLKEYDPDIKIIVNWHSTFRKFAAEYDELLSVAGHNIDIIDVHWYNMWSNASWDQWLSRTPIGVFTKDSYETEIKMFHEIAAKNGFPEMGLACLEWNVGPGKKAEGPRLNPAQSALIESEMMIQFIRGGLEMATFWPLFWDGEFNFRSFFNKDNQTLNPISDVMQKFGALQGMQVLDMSLSQDAENMLAFAVRDSGSRITVCVLNKNSYPVALDLSSGIKGAVAVESYRISADLQSLDFIQEKVDRKDLEAAPYSLTFLNFK